MSDQNFVLFNWDGMLVGQVSFQEKKIICTPVINNSNYENSKFIHSTLESTITVISHRAWKKKNLNTSLSFAQAAQTHILLARGHF